MAPDDTVTLSSVVVELHALADLPEGEWTVEHEQRWFKIWPTFHQLALRIRDVN